jgi:hypothetical protein
LERNGGRVAGCVGCHADGRAIEGGWQKRQKTWVRSSPCEMMPLYCNLSEVWDLFRTDDGGILRNQSCMWHDND